MKGTAQRILTYDILHNFPTRRMSRKSGEFKKQNKGEKEDSRQYTRKMPSKVE